MATWRIYYGDDTTAEGDTRAEFIAAPARNVQVIVTVDFYPLDSVYNVGRLTPSGADYYMWPVNVALPIPMDAIGVLDRLIEQRAATLDSNLADFSIAQLSLAGVKIGRWIDKIAYLTLLDRAIADPGFPAKSAFRHGDDFAARRLPHLAV